MGMLGCYGAPCSRLPECALFQLDGKAQTVEAFCSRSPLRKGKEMRIIVNSNFKSLAPIYQLKFKFQLVRPGEQFEI